MHKIPANTVVRKKFGDQHRVILFVVVILFVLFNSCRVSLVPAYSAELEEQISKTAKANDRLYIDLLDEPKEKRSYENFKQRYNDIESEINSIQLKNEAREHNGDFIVINKNLKDAFSEAKKYHKEHVTLTDGE